MSTQVNKKFLTELLEIPSPSGNIKKIQKRWLNYVKDFADEVKSDLMGNVYATLNPNADFKVMLAAHCDEIGFIVSGIDEKGYIYFSKVGGISPKAAIGMRLEILGYRGESITGVFGGNAEHHGGVKEKLEFTDIFLDCGFKTKEEAEKYVKIGDLAVYKTNPEYLFNDLVSSRALDDKSGIFMIAEVLKKLSNENLEIGVCAASVVNEETNQLGSYFAASQFKPNVSIVCDVTFATDYPSVNKAKYGEVNLEGGPVLAKGSPINNKLNELLEKEAEALEINLQYELTPGRTGTDADTISKTGIGVPVVLVSLPLRYMHYPTETASLKDMEAQIELLYNMLKNLKKDINLSPLAD